MTLSIIFHKQCDEFVTLLKTDSSFLRKALRLALKKAQLSSFKFQVAVVLSDDAAVQDLNRDFRHKDKPTNVLSFPQIEDFNALDPNTTHELGDIILAFETVQTEALEQHKSLRDHVAHLLVHGLLHLCGYDHQDDAEANEMEALETEILAQLAIADPYL